jgi:hypothetical protein
MVRPWRVEFEGAVYHVMCRGVAREKMLRDREDYGRFEEYRAAAVQKFALGKLRAGHDMSLRLFSK